MWLFSSLKILKMHLLAFVAKKLKPDYYDVLPDDKCDDTSLL